MYYITEKNERRTRQNALVMAVVLHLALAAVLFLSASEKPSSKQTKSTPTKEQLSVPVAKAKTVSVP